MATMDGLSQVLAMCFVRKGLDYVFTRHELKWLDDIIPESHKREKEEKKKRLLANAVGLFAEVLTYLLYLLSYIAGPIGCTLLPSPLPFLP